MIHVWPTTLDSAVALLLSRFDPYMLDALRQATDDEALRMVYLDHVFTVQFALGLTDGRNWMLLTYLSTGDVDEACLLVLRATRDRLPVATPTGGES